MKGMPNLLKIIFYYVGDIIENLLKYLQSLFRKQLKNRYEEKTLTRISKETHNLSNKDLCFIVVLNYVKDQSSFFVGLKDSLGSFIDESDKGIF